MKNNVKRLADVAIRPTIDDYCPTTGMSYRLEIPISENGLIECQFSHGEQYVISKYGIGNVHLKSRFCIDLFDIGEFLSLTENIPVTSGYTVVSKLLQKSVSVSVLKNHTVNNKGIMTCLTCDVISPEQVNLFQHYHVRWLDTSCRKHVCYYYVFIPDLTVYNKLAIILGGCTDIYLIEQYISDTVWCDFPGSSH